jgi:ribosomal protein S27E
MSEAIAKSKFTCPSCGGEAVWNPAKQILACAFCGTQSPIQIQTQTGEIVEHDLVTALRGLTDDQRGWKTERIEVKCQSCQAVSVFDPEKVSQACAFCGSTALVPYSETKDPISPESLLPFLISETQVREMIRAWYGAHWFAPNALAEKAITDTLKGLYLPYWTFDAQVHAEWSAESGEHYYETEKDSDGNERQVQHTRWYWTSGAVDHFFDDELVPASKGANADLLEKVEPFPTDQLKTYDPAYLSGWTVERYQIDLVSAAQRSRELMEAKVEQLCARDVPGDTYRNLRVRAEFTQQTFKHILVPVWFLSYVYSGENYQVIVNGVTGGIAGKYPYSWIKITLAVIVGIIFLLVLLHFSQG